MGLPKHVARLVKSYRSHLGDEGAGMAAGEHWAKKAASYDQLTRLETPKPNKRGDTQDLYKARLVLAGNETTMSEVSEQEASRFWKDAGWEGELAPSDTFVRAFEQAALNVLGDARGVAAWRLPKQTPKEP
jgi:hypothetical protein